MHVPDADQNPAEEIAAGGAVRIVYREYFRQ